MNDKDVVTDFWKTIKPLLSNKIKSSEKICLVKSEKVVTNDKEVATRGVLEYKVFLEISQNSKETTCVRASF